MARFVQGTGVLPGRAAAVTEDPYRSGRWPGLTPRGAGVLLGCALLLAAGQALSGSPRQPLPGLPVLAVLSLVPLIVATRIVRTPGAASAVCGAYLLPRSLLSLVDPAIEPPPLLLVPGVAFDVCAWLQPGDLAGVLHVWPRRLPVWRKRSSVRRGVGLARGVLASATFGLVLAIVQPPLAILLGADVSVWSGPTLWLATAVSTAACALVGVGARGPRS